MLGPNFSGALDSIGEHTADLNLRNKDWINGFCLVPSATTDSTNSLAILTEAST